MTTNDPLDSFPSVSYDVSLGEETQHVEATAPAPVAVNGVPTNAWLAGAPQLWNEGYTGKGMIVGLVDTGIDLSHPAFQCTPSGKHKVIKQVDMTTAIDYSEGINVPVNYFHGTAMAGLIAGYSTDGYRGVAPNAQIVSYQYTNNVTGDPINSSSPLVDWDEVEAQGNADITQIQIDRAAQAIRNCVHDGCHVINLSIGLAQTRIEANNLDLTMFNRAIEFAFLHGVVCFVASGNTGEATFNGMAANPAAVGVGSVDYQPLAGQITQSPFSSPNQSGVRVADVTHMGGVVNPCAYDPNPFFPNPIFISMLAMSTVAWGPINQFLTVRGLTNLQPQNTLYIAIFAFGTSNSTAITSGFAMLMKERHRSQTAAELRLHVESQALDLFTPSYDRFSGYGLPTTYTAPPVVQGYGQIDPECPSSAQAQHVRQQAALPYGLFM